MCFFFLNLTLSRNYVHQSIFKDNAINNIVILQEFISCKSNQLDFYTDKYYFDSLTS